MDIKLFYKLNNEYYDDREKNMKWNEIFETDLFQYLIII
jgi:hypothetical protein